MSLLEQAECQTIFDRAQRAARAAGVDDIEICIGANATALTRFANNAIHQNVAERDRMLSVRALIGQRTARATTNRTDDDSIRRVVEEAIALTKVAEPDPALLPLVSPEEAGEIGAAPSRFDSATAATTPEQRALAVKEAIGIVESASTTAAGIFETGEESEALLNSRGLFRFHTETSARFSITATANDSSGWAKASAVSAGAIDPAALARSAADKARLSAEPRELPPGRYTVVLEPAAVLDLVGQIFADFSATAIFDQRSFLTGRDLAGLFGENVVIHDDAYHPLQSGAPFDGEGVARRALRLVDCGTVRDIPYSRASARRAGVAATGHGLALPNDTGEMPINIVIAGGGSTLDEMIASVDRGILVTRLWYIREVDPFEKIMTGMTRDGTFLIEGGRPVHGIRNFRFNQSVVEMLRNVVAMSAPVRSSGEEAFDLVAPAMTVANFNFTEVTRF
jgi:predicted Zn-dependent protease